METPKKYTFALVEVKWVLFCMDFSKIAVLFLCILIFVFFATKIVDFGCFCDFNEEKDRITEKWPPGALGVACAPP